MDMGITERVHMHTVGGEAGRVYLQTIAICKQTLKPTSWISNALGERVGVSRRSKGQPWHLHLFGPRASRPI